MMSFRYGVLSFLHGPGIADVFESSIRYLSAHSETDRFSGGFNWRMASLMYWETLYFRIWILFLFSSTFLLFFCVFRANDSGNYKRSKEAVDLFRDFLLHTPGFCRL